jgi:type I restriction enzyme, S subunit
MSSWPLVALGDVFEIARGGSPRPIDEYITDEADGLNWITISDASDGSKYITGTKRRIRRDGAKRSRMVQPGDLLLTNSMSFGRPYIMRTSGCIHDGWLVLTRKAENVDSDFFFHLLGSKAVYSEFERRAAGVTVKNLNIELVKGVHVAFPPLPEQRRIAGVLDRADALRAKRRDALAQLDALARSIFLEMFGDPATNPKRWPVASIAEVGEVYTGKTPPTMRDGMFGGDIPFATPGDLDAGLARTERTLTDAGAAYCKVVRAGSALVGCIGNIGKMAKTPVRSSFNQQINAVEWSSSVDDDFGIAALAFAKPQMLALSSSTTVPILNKSGFSKVAIPVPPVSLQRRFGQRVGAVERLKAAHRASFAALDALFASLQHRAFRGEL